MIIIFAGFLLCACTQMRDPLTGEIIYTSSRYTTSKAFWKRLQKSFQLDHYIYKPEVKSQIYWFQTHQALLYRMLTNSGPYMFYVYQEVERKDLPGELALLPVIESAYNPFACSRVGAVGLWQLMPATALDYGVKQNWWYDGRRDIYISTEAALNHLIYLRNLYHGNWELALAAYNAGEGKVQNAMSKNYFMGYSSKFWYLPLPLETRTYVPRLLALAAIIKNPSRYGITLPAIKDGPYFAKVDVGHAVDLQHAAKLADVSIKELYQLNPGYNRWTPDPSGPYHLLLPIEKIDLFKTNLAVDAESSIDKSSSSKMSAFKSSLLGKTHQDTIVYAVKLGDTLAKIAQRYHVTTNQIISWNELNPNEELKVGQRLILLIVEKYPSRTSTSKVTSKQRLTAKPAIYHVRKGDTLSGIAKRFKVSAIKLKQVNHLATTNQLKIGQSLRIP